MRVFVPHGQDNDFSGKNLIMEMNGQFFDFSSSSFFLTAANNRKKKEILIASLTSYISSNIK